MRGFGWPVLFVCIAMHPGSAVAEDPGGFEEARRAFEHGIDLLRQGDPAQAIESFERSLALRHSLSALYNLGLAYRAVGRPRDALHAFERFLDRAVAEKHVEGVEHAKLLAEELRGTIGRITLVVAGGADSVRVDGERIGDRDGTYGLVLDPGDHLLEVKSAASERTESVRLQPGATMSVRLELEKKAEPIAAPPAQLALPSDAPPPASEPLVEQWWFWTIVGVVAAGAAAGIIVAVRSPEPEYDGGTNGVLLEAIRTR